MPINDIAHGLRRVGKIRLGEQVATQNGKTRPAKLTTLRFTSQDEHAIRSIAAQFGGEVRPWDNDGADEWEVVTDASSVDILITPEADAFSQWYELWKAGGCQRRCDGEIETLSGKPCASLCPQDREERSEKAKTGNACKATTRVSVVLPSVPALGSWMVESHGYYAAKELASTFALLDMAGARRGLLPGRLRLEQRTVKRDGKRQDFGVPVIDVAVGLESLFGELVAPPGVNPTTGEIGGGATAALPPAAPVTSTKKAAARKEAAAKEPAPPISDETLEGFRSRIAVFEPEIRSLCAQMMNQARVSLKNTPTVDEVKTIEKLLAEVEAKQAAAWEDRRKAVFVAVGDGVSDADRHALLAKATAELAPEDGGPTESTKTLTQAQANTILDYLDTLGGAA